MQLSLFNNRKLPQTDSLGNDQQVALCSMEPQIHQSFCGERKSPITFADKPGKPEG